MSSLIKFVYQKNFKAIEHLITDGVDVNSTDSDGRTALIHAVLDSEPNIEIVKLLLRLGINVDHQDDGQHWSALHFSARDNHIDIVLALLKSGASIDLLDAFGNTPLWRAVMSYGGNSAVIEALLSYRANPEKENNSGVSPRVLAETMGKHELLTLFQ
ncbi:ankyrin repeat domain-containing protein [Pseudoalteromonas luteoviolacea]|uniref:ankyrin repeat domain-containing protein n=1 Tax=Pseudoalteromonas luteoviolacea TaxID=43657 RepID=UPI00163C579D|nr:ankyrin repeat domain-containing protein [Pseudoalteromonas luteoviolacea]